MLFKEEGHMKLLVIGGTALKLGGADLDIAKVPQVVDSLR